MMTIDEARRALGRRERRIGEVSSVELFPFVVLGTVALAVWLDYTRGYYRRHPLTGRPL